MPQTELADRLHAQKVRGEGESFREWSNRAAAALADHDAHFHRLRDMWQEQRTLPGGRIQAGAGSPRIVTLFNCFVSGTINDSLVTGPNSILDMVKEAAATMRMGGGIGYNFSTLRPRGTPISTLGSQSSGPVSFMGIYDANCKTIQSAGDRRGAQMAVLDVDHPDIEEYVRAKQNSDQLQYFNTSVAVKDDFMRAVATGTDYALQWGGQVYGRVNARNLWEEIMRSTWDWAEPGVVFIDTINRLNNLWYCEEIRATNPCGEQPLPPYGACLLGSVCLPKYVTPERGFDWNTLARDLADFVRALDNVVDASAYPLPQQRREAHDKRRMGIGVTGLANAGEFCAGAYGSEAFIDFERRVLAFIRDRVYTESALLALEKGPFPLFDRDKYLAGEFTKRLPPAVRDLIANHGIRNSHLTSIAPTGTISLYADNVSSGIEPVFAYEVERRVLTRDGPVTLRLPDYGVRVLGVHGKPGREVTVDEHIEVLATAQEYVDSAVSKTVNCNPAMPWADFKEVYMRAWERGCKGVATYTPNGNREDVVREAGCASGTCDL